MMHNVEQNPAGPYFLGVDGGGSKTVAIIVDAQGHERGRGTAGGANHRIVGLPIAIANVRSATEDAMRAATCNEPLQAAWLGLAGIDRTGDYKPLLPPLRTLARHVQLTGDAELALAALDDSIGIGLIAGTGSVALGRDAHGTVRRSGGWGHLFGDEGSGFEMGRLALQAAARAADGRGKAVRLLALIMQHWQIKEPSDIIDEVYQEIDNGKIARLSALVFLAAREGDIVARRIVRRAAEELALAVISVSNTLDFATMPLPIALSGGLLLHEADFREEVLAHIRRRKPIGRVVTVEEPALAAACAAIRLSIHE